MKYCDAILLLLMVTPALAAGDPVPVPRIIDSESNRVPAQTVVPEYPRKARRDRIGGEVQVCFHVDRKGRVHGASVRTSTHRVFERPSIKAVRASTFRPLGDKQPLPPLKSCRTFVFSLETVDPGAD